MSLIILLVIIGVLSWFIISTYNSLIAKIEAVNNSKKQIDVQLDRRHKVFASLIESVKKIMDYEQTTLKDVVALRNSAISARKSGNIDAEIKAEEQLSKIAGGINVLVEQYPQLKATENMGQLQEEIVNTENKLSFAKQSYNDSIEDYNTHKKSFIASMIVSFFAKKLDFDFHYWSLSEEKISNYEEETVKF